MDLNFYRYPHLFQRESPHPLQAYIYTDRTQKVLSSQSLRTTPAKKPALDGVKPKIDIPE